MTENLGQMGVPIPSFVKERIEKLRDLTDKGDGQK
ncbi:phage holin family protein [Enterococcus cecorum]|nr:phage holin family protein [Enterococcus cecorum]